MTENNIQVCMLGGFSIARGDRKIDDGSNRMRKVWLLLAYMIYNRNRHIPQESYLSLLQGKAGDEALDPNGNLKALFYRARTMLNQIDDDAGHNLIVRKSGSYNWNTDLPLQLDVEQFEQLCKEGSAAENDAARLELLLQALNLYRGDFLPKLSSENWVMPIAAYYHSLYLDTVGIALEILEAQSRWNEAAALCETALKIDPYSEALYQHLMNCKITLGDRAGASAIYEEMSELLFSHFGVMPSDESRAIYREALRSNDSGATIPVGTVREQLRETTEAKGALFCEYDFFRLYYQAQARAIARSGDVIHIALFSVHGRGKKELPRRSLDRAMENLKEQIIGNLRQGDIVTQCSVSQLIVMLPQANYENSCAVCDRLLKNFNRQYPHSPVDIHVSVQPLEPLETIPGRNADN